MSEYAHEDNIAALAAGSFYATLEMARLIGESEFRYLIHQGEKTSIYMESATQDLLLVVVFSKDSNPGLVKLYARHACDQLAAFAAELTANAGQAGGPYKVPLPFEIDESAQPLPGRRRADRPRPALTAICTLIPWNARRGVGHMGHSVRRHNDARPRPYHFRGGVYLLVRQRRDHAGRSDTGTSGMNTQIPPSSHSRCGVGLERLRCEAGEETGAATRHAFCRRRVRRASGPGRSRALPVRCEARAGRCAGRSAAGEDLPSMRRAGRSRCAPGLRTLGWKADGARQVRASGVPGLELSWQGGMARRSTGLGERFDGLNQAGKVVDMWIEDAPGQGDANRQSYYVTPVLYSTRGYAFFAAQNPEGTFDLELQPATALHRYRRAGQAMTFYVAFGDSLKELVGKRESVQGPHKGIPDWAWGPWISRNSFENQAEAEEAIKGMVQRKLPVAAIVQEAWKGSSEAGDFNNFDTGRWPDLRAYFELCAEHDIKNVLWQVPVIHPSSPEFATGKEKGYFVKKPDGSISFRQNWLQGLREHRFHESGRGEVLAGPHAPDGAARHLGIQGRRRRGHQAGRRLLRRPPRLGDAQRVLDALQPRADRTHEAGGRGRPAVGAEREPRERAYPALWAGDQYARWGQLASLVPAGLSASMSGMPFWGHDIGGYMEQPTPELYIRWAQFGALSPLMQYHGVRRREPWEFGPQADGGVHAAGVSPDESQADADRARARGGRRPACRSCARWRWSFPDDARFATMDNQYMLGPDLLVAPVLEEGRTGRRVEFPAGIWQHAVYPVAFEGPATLEVPIGLLDAPLFVREGATLKLQLKEGAKLGEWSPDDPVRDVRFGPDRVVLRNLKAPLTGNLLTRTATIKFDLAPGFTGTAPRALVPRHELVQRRRGPGVRSRVAMRWRM